MNSHIVLSVENPKILWVGVVLLLLIGAGTAMIGALSTPMLCGDVLMGALIFVCTGTIAEFYYNPRVLKGFGALGMQALASIMCLIGTYTFGYLLFGVALSAPIAFLLFGEGVLLWSFGVYAFWRIDLASYDPATKTKG